MPTRPNMDLSPPRILVVEDSEAAQRVTMSILTQALSAGVGVVSSVAAALRLLDRPDPPVDLVLTDLALPDDPTGGVAIAKFIRDQPPERWGRTIPVMLVTGADWGGFDRKLFTHVLLKPVALDMFVVAVRTALQEVSCSKR